MTDIARRLAWKEVQHLVRVTSDDWPERLPPCDIGQLHAWDGCKVDRLKADALESLLIDEISAGRLRAQTVKRIEWPLVFGCDDADWEDWEITRDVVSGDDVARALGSVELGRYLKVWLQPFLPSVRGLSDFAWQSEARAPTVKKQTQADRVGDWLQECESRSRDKGEPFDRACMPGTKAEFLLLLHALDAEMRSIRTTESLDRYLTANECKWPLDASAQPSATSLYAQLFPEAHIHTPGASPVQCLKA